MRPLVRILLVLSLGANAVWLAIFFRASSQSLPVPPRTRPSPSALSNRATLGAPPAVTSTETATAAGSSPVTLAEPAVAVDWMRAQGFPDSIIDSVMASLTMEKYGVYELQDELKRNRTPAVQQRMSEMNDRSNQEYFNLVSSTRVTESLRLGSLEESMVRKVKELEREYDKNSDADFAEAIGGVLSGRELDDYLRFNSILARSVQQLVRSVDIDEQTYQALYRAAVDREGTATPSGTPREIANRLVSPESMAEMRRILGDEKFLTVGIWQYQDFSSANAVFESAALPASARADLFLETYRRLYQPGNLSGPGMAAHFQEIYRTVVEKAGLDADAQARLSATQYGRMARGSGSVRTGANWAVTRVQ